jgi:hypothetical protein
VEVINGKGGLLAHPLESTPLLVQELVCVTAALTGTFERIAGIQFVVAERQGTGHGRGPKLLEKDWLRIVSAELMLGKATGEVRSWCSMARDHRRLRDARSAREYVRVVLQQVPTPVRTSDTHIPRSNQIAGVGKGGREVRGGEREGGGRGVKDRRREGGGGVRRGW